MVIGGDGMVEPFMINGTEVEQVTQLNFLGSLITTNCKYSAEVKKHLPMTKSAMVGL